MVGQHPKLTLPPEFSYKINIRNTDTSETVNLDHIKFTEEMKYELSTQYDRCLSKQEHDFLAKCDQSRHAKILINGTLEYRFKINVNKYKTLKDICPSFEINGIKFTHTTRSIKNTMILTFSNISTSVPI